MLQLQNEYSPTNLSSNEMALLPIEGSRVELKEKLVSKDILLDDFLKQSTAVTVKEQKLSLSIKWQLTRISISEQKTGPIRGIINNLLKTLIHPDQSSLFIKTLIRENQVVLRIKLQDSFQSKASNEGILLINQQLAKGLGGDLLYFETKHEITWELSFPFMID
jgi:hypothetical protein